jgi:hypothetical protein
MRHKVKIYHNYRGITEAKEKNPEPVKFCPGGPK